MVAPAEPHRPSFPSATDPAGIRAGLPAEKVADFDRSYAEALAEAGASLTLTPVLDMLESWHRLACLHTTDPAGYRRVRQIADRYQATGELPPGTSIEVTRARLEHRLAQARIHG